MHLDADAYDVLGVCVAVHWDTLSPILVVFLAGLCRTYITGLWRDVSGSAAPEDDCDAAPGDDSGCDRKRGHDVAQYDDN